MFLVPLVDKKISKLFQEAQVCRSSFNKSWKYAEGCVSVCCKIFKSWIAGDVGVAANFSIMLFLTTITVINFQFLKLRHSFRYSKIQDRVKY